MALTGQEEDAVYNDCHQFAGADYLNPPQCVPTLLYQHCIDTATLNTQHHLWYAVLQTTALLAAARECDDVSQKKMLGTCLT